MGKNKVENLGTPETIGMLERPAVKIPTTEYDRLIRESETLYIVKKYVEYCDYVNTDTLRMMLGIDKEEGEK